MDCFLRVITLVLVLGQPVVLIPGQSVVTYKRQGEDYFRRDRQLFVTMPSTGRNYFNHGNGGSYRPNNDSKDRLTTVFLSSSSPTSSSSTTVKYIPLSQDNTIFSETTSPSTSTSTTTTRKHTSDKKTTSVSANNEPFSSTTTGVQQLHHENVMNSSTTPASQYDLLTTSGNMKSKQTSMDAHSDASYAEHNLVKKNAAKIEKTRNPPSLTSTSTSPSVFGSPYSISATNLHTANPSENPNDVQSYKHSNIEGSNDKDNEVTEQRSALIRMPSRDAQVIFLADDPEAAAKIPGLLTKLQQQSIESKKNLFPRRGDESTESYSRFTNPEASLPETEYTLLDLDKSSFPDKGSSPGIRHTYKVEDSTEPINAVQGRDDGVSPRLHSDGYRPTYEYRKPFGGAKEVYSKYNVPRIRGSNLASSNMNMTRVTHIEAECQDDYMIIHTQFNGSFGGLIYSAGYAYDRDCIYINGTGRNYYDFHIELNRCGTLGGNEKGALDIRGRPTQKNMMWNTLTVQYNPLIEEEWDEHFKVTCEYGYDFWKTVTFPFLDVEVQTGNPVVFTLTPPECHMEILYGYGTGGQRITGPVRVGDPLTLVIYMRSELDGFDIVVSDCFAHNGGNKRISLIDHYGCPVDEKLISHFEGTRSEDGRYETQVYAFMKTFRFTGSPALYIECDVRMCHGECPPQPCHWKRATRERRSLSRSGPTASMGNVSESLNLFQALQVLQGDEPLLRSSSVEGMFEGVTCLKNGAFTAAAGGVASLLTVLSVACVAMCLRSRQRRKAECGSKPKSTVDPGYKSDFVPSTRRRLE